MGANDRLVCAAGFCSGAGAEAGRLEVATRAVGTGVVFVAGQTHALAMALVWAGWGWPPHGAVLGESVATGLL